MTIENLSVYTEPLKGLKYSICIPPGQIHIYMRKVNLIKTTVDSEEKAAAMSGIGLFKTTNLMRCQKKTKK